MKVEPSKVGRPGVMVVSVDVNELVTPYGTMQFGTWIGTINVITGKIEVWTPAAQPPKGYKTAAKALLRKALEQAKGQG